MLPQYDVRERHEIDVDAPAERVFAAVRETTFAEMPLARMLFRVRGLPAAAARPVFDQLPKGFAVLAEEPGSELVVGGIGQPWKLSGGEMRSADVRSFDTPGYARMVMNFHLEGRTLSTETRVALTDERSRRLFRRYWRVVRPGSGLIRRAWLRAIKRRAERSAAAE